MRKPALIVTYGGGGGLRCAETLKTLLGGSYKMPLVAEKGVAIKWPKGSKQVPVEGPAPDWLRAHESKVLRAVEELNALLIKAES